MALSGLRFSSSRWLSSVALLLVAQFFRAALGKRLSLAERDVEVTLQFQAPEGGFKRSTYVAAPNEVLFDVRKRAAKEFKLPLYLVDILTAVDPPKVMRGPPFTVESAATGGILEVLAAEDGVQAVTLHVALRQFAKSAGAWLKEKDAAGVPKYLASPGVGEDHLEFQGVVALATEVYHTIITQEPADAKAMIEDRFGPTALPGELRGADVEVPKTPKTVAGLIRGYVPLAYHASAMPLDHDVNKALRDFQVGLLGTLKKQRGAIAFSSKDVVSAGVKPKEPLSLTSALLPGEAVSIVRPPPYADFQHTVRLILNVPSEKVLEAVAALLTEFRLLSMDVSTPATLPKGTDVTDKIVLFDSSRTGKTMERVAQVIKRIGGPFDLPGPACTKPVRIDGELFPGLFMASQLQSERFVDAQPTFAERVGALFTSAYLHYMGYRTSDANVTAAELDVKVMAQRRKDALPEEQEGDEFESDVSGDFDEEFVEDLEICCTAMRAKIAETLVQYCISPVQAIKRLVRSATKTTPARPRSCGKDFEDFLLELQAEFPRHGWGLQEPSGVKLPIEAQAPASRPAAAHISTDVASGSPAPSSTKAGGVKKTKPPKKVKWQPDHKLVESQE